MRIKFIGCEALSPPYEAAQVKGEYDYLSMWQRRLKAEN